MVNTPITSIDPLAGLHDANLTGIAADGDDLRLTIVGERSQLLIVRHLVFLVASPFLKGNIIDRARIHDFDVGVREKLAVSEVVRSALFDVYGPSPESERFSEHKVLELTSSYGCEVLAVFKGEVEVEAL